jgi:hypothetical protein
MTDCDICCEYKTDLIICSYCKKQVCETCIQKFIEDKLREPLCMNCGNIWSREFVLENIINKKWFFQHIGKYILEQEKMLLPETQEEAFLISRIQELSQCLKSLPTNQRLKSMYKNLDIRSKAIEEKRDILWKIKCEIHSTKGLTITYGGIGSSRASTKRDHYIFKCPSDCRGFISNNYSCGTCKGLVCKKCRVQIKEDLEHICNEDDIKSSALVSSLTKPCPKCMTPILKSGGCDQMFCVLCHTAFSWTTGKIEVGVIHNPHYYEYLSTLTTPITDIEVLACGDIPDAMTYIKRITTVTNSQIFIRKLTDLHLIARHMRHTIVPSWQINKVKDNIDIRVQYLLGEIDETTWESKLLFREKKRMKIKAFHDLIQMVLLILEDFVRRVFSFDILDIENWHSLSSSTIVEAVYLKKYYCTSLSQICKVHGGTIPLEISTAFPYSDE